jgi:uncharacterized membrane protein
LPPVFVVPVGKDDPVRDVAIETVSVNLSAFEDAPVTIRVDARMSGYEPTKLVAILFDENDREVERQSLSAEEGEPVAFRFHVRPEKPGVSFYRARVAAEDELGQWSDKAALRESTLANNERLVVVDRGEGPFRVLYVAGRPNWDFKFIRRAVQEDEQVQLVGLIRIAKREPKFNWLDRSVQDSNALYTGFEGKDEELAERYDEPVLVRLGTQDDNELRGGFPKSAEDLYPYHALVIDNTEAEFFTTDQIALIEKFVSERGGGLLMMGGVESLAEGKYARTRLEGLLPVYLEGRRGTRAQGPFRLVLSRDGWHQPWVRLRANEEDERRRLADMPTFRTFNRIGGVKPGAIVLSEVSDSAGTEWPALVAQRFGNGRSSVLTIADTWRWQLRGVEGQDDFGKAWRQTIRWLVSDVPNRVTLESHAPAGRPDAPVQFLVRARDKRFEPLDYARVKLEIEPPQGPTIRLDAEPTARQSGQFQSSFLPVVEGAYRATATVLDGAGNEVGRAVAGWTAEPAAEEFRNLTPNRDLLAEIAERTGGEVVELDQLDRLARSMPSRAAPITEQHLSPLWHQPLVLLVALSCLITEWGIRRRRGLP